MAVWILVLCFCGTRITEVCNRFRGENRKIGGSSREGGERGGRGERGEGREEREERLHN